MREDVINAGAARLVTRLYSTTLLLSFCSQCHNKAARAEAAKVGVCSERKRKGEKQRARRAKRLCHRCRSKPPEAPSGSERGEGERVQWEAGR